MERTRVYQAIAVCVLAVLCASTAFAQESTLDRERDPALDGTENVIADLSYASIRRGSVYFLYQFDLADVTLDPGFVPSRDEDLGLSLGASLPTRVYWVPSRKFAISGDLTPAYTIVERDGIEGRGGYAVRADAHLMLNHLYVNAYTEKADLVAPLPTELGGLGTARRTTTGVDSEVKYSSRTSLLLTASRHETSYSGIRLRSLDVDPSRYDTNEDRFRATALHHTFPRISLTVSGEASNYDFPRQGYATAQRRHAAAGATWLRRRARLRAEAGPATVSFGSPGYDDFSGMVGSAQFSSPIGRRWNVTSMASRDVNFSDYAGNAYYRSDELGGRLELAATRRLSVHLTPIAQSHRYDTPVGGVRRRDDYTSLLAGWTYAFSKLRGGFDVGYYERHSNITAEDASGIRLIIRLSFTGSSGFK